MYTDCEVVKLRKGNVAYVRDGELVAKTCTKCASLKDASEFSGNRSKKFNKESSCKTCCSKQQMEWATKNKEHLSNYYSENRERYNQLARERRSRNYEKVRQRELAYNEKTKERRRHNRKQWYSKNQEHVKQYRRDNRERYRLHWLNRRDKARSLPFGFTKSQKEEVVRFFGGCALTGSTDYHLDHVIPVATGHGGTVVGNMMPLRADLNMSKSDKNVYEWFAANKERFNLSQERFDAAMSYMAGLNGLTPEEYREYVYECHTQQMIS